MDNDDALITARYKALEGVLDRRQRRLYAAAEAKVLGHGGAKRVWNATGVALGSILAGLKELDDGLTTPIKLICVSTMTYVVSSSDQVMMG